MGKLSRDKGVEITEKALRELVRELCALFGWKFHFIWTSIHSPKGFPDLVLRKPPRLIFAELKREKAKLTPSQKDWQADLKACGQEVYVWRPSQVDEIAAILRR